MRTELTPAEKSTIEGLFAGLSYKEIAALQGVSDATIRSRAKVLFAKFAVDTRKFEGRVKLTMVAHFLRDQLGVVCNSCVKADSVPAGSVEAC